MLRAAVSGLSHCGSEESKTLTSSCTAPHCWDRTAAHLQTASVQELEAVLDTAVHLVRFVPNPSLHLAGSSGQARSIGLGRVETGTSSGVLRLVRALLRREGLRVVAVWIMGLGLPAVSSIKLCGRHAAKMLNASEKREWTNGRRPVGL